MRTLQIQRRPLYSIGTVARLTGINQNTLRVWERRYGLGASQKTVSGRRRFTQSDLEHLQLVAALVASGTRVGDIANAERRTLELLLHPLTEKDGEVYAERRSRFLFVGEQLCEWLDMHQGCLSGVDAMQLPAPLGEACGVLLQELEDIDGVVVEVVDLGEVSVQRVTALAQTLDTDNVLVLHRHASDSWLRELGQRGFMAAGFPPEPAMLASHLSVSGAVKNASEGIQNLGELVHAKPRLFDEQELVQAARLEDALSCECPKHIVSLVRALAEFEEYSSSCTVENWTDASVHACLYAYAGQARWLMEKALMLATEAPDMSEEQGDSDEK